MVANLSKTKVMIFNTSKKFLQDFHLLFHGGKVEITVAYTDLGVQFLSAF
jgi:hypothetical protein